MQLRQLIITYGASIEASTSLNPRPLYYASISGIGTHYKNLRLFLKIQKKQPSTLCVIDGLLVKAQSIKTQFGPLH
jgi:uncharacterized membrane protein